MRLRLAVTLRIERDRPEPTPPPESREGQADALVDMHPPGLPSIREYPFGFQPHPDQPEDHHR